LFDQWHEWGVAPLGFEPIPYRSFAFRPAGFATLTIASNAAGNFFEIWSALVEIR
jgi:hypothetical protein